jgi:hypothetical protein
VAARHWILEFRARQSLSQRLNDRNGGGRRVSGYDVHVISRHPLRLHKARSADNDHPNDCYEGAAHSLRRPYLHLRFMQLFRVLLLEGQFG